MFPTLDIYSKDFLDSDTIVGTFALSDNQSGFEELAIGGYRFTAPNRVPEPASLALAGLGLAALGFSRRHKASKAS